MQCLNCEKTVSDNARFCDQCGHVLEILPQIELEEPIDPIEADLLLPDDMNTVKEEMVGLEPLLAVEPAANEPEPVTISTVSPTDELLTSGPRLVLIDEQSEGETSYPLATDHAIIVGREDPIDGIYPDIDLTLHDTDTGVSRQHASLHEQGGQWFIQDLASTNYTIVNRRRLTPHEDYLLEDGDELRFGRVTAQFKA